MFTFFNFEVLDPKNGKLCLDVVLSHSFDRLDQHMIEIIYSYNHITHHMNAISLAFGKSTRCSGDSSCIGVLNPKLE